MYLGLIGLMVVEIVLYGSSDDRVKAVGRIYIHYVQNVSVGVRFECLFECTAGLACNWEFRLLLSSIRRAILA